MQQRSRSLAGFRSSEKLAPTIMRSWRTCSTTNWMCKSRMRISKLQWPMRREEKRRRRNKMPSTAICIDSFTMSRSTRLSKRPRWQPILKTQIARLKFLNGSRKQHSKSWCWMNSENGELQKKLWRNQIFCQKRGSRSTWQKLTKGFKIQKCRSTINLKISRNKKTISWTLM